MSIRIIIGTTASVFIAFGLMLAISISIAAYDEAYDTRWELESRVEELQRKIGR